MEVRLLKHVLVADGDFIPTRAGQVVEVDEDRGREFIDLGIAVATQRVPVAEEKMAAEPENKMLRVASNKARPSR